MSSNTLTFTCIGSDEPALAALHRQLEAAIGLESDQWPEPLRGTFDDWERPFVTSASLRGQTLRFVIDSSSGDELEKSHFQALHAAGAEHIRIRTFYSSVGETQTLHIHGAKRVAAKAFPTPTLSEGERLYELVIEGKDSALVKEIKAGASPDAVIDGKPLLVHVARARMEKPFLALLAAKADLSPCLPWAQDVASAMSSHGGKKTEALLQSLVSVPGADPAALWRSAGLMRVLSGFPKPLAWLMAQPGVDVSAQLVADEDPSEAPHERGSLLFNSVDFFKDNAEVLALLAAHGARSVPPATMSDERRIHRMFWRERDAETVPQLAAAGVDLDLPFWHDYTLLRSLLRTPCSDRRTLPLANELLDAGASAAFWMDPKTFQHEVLTTLFDAKDRISYRRVVESIGAAEAGIAEGDLFDVARDGTLIVDFLSRLLARGLDANMEVTLTVMALSRHFDQDIRHPRLRYRGPLLGAITGLLCGRGSDLRPLCLPLAELLLQHGASPHAPAEAVTGPWDGDFLSVLLNGRWPGNTWHLAPEGTVLERLRQRQAESPDEIDAAVIAALEASSPRP